MSEPAVQLENLKRRFGAITAVQNASLHFDFGCIHAVVGENGAGKSTLLSMAGGALEPTSGRVLVKGIPLHPATPAEAIRRGIGFVHQHFMLVEAFSVLENIVLGAEPTKRSGVLDMAEARRKANHVLHDLDISLDLDAKVSDLGIGQRQNLEILRILTRGASIILLDEPTAVLTPSQAMNLYAMLKKMADTGACIVVVTHRLQEVLDHSQHVTVMRRGSIVSSRPTSEASAHGLTRDIMGQEPLPPVERPDDSNDSEIALELKNLRVSGSSTDRSVVDGIDLRVPQGRIVGIAGVEGNGQGELIRAIAGLLPVQSGQVLLGGQDISKLSVAARRAAGLSVVHDDRHRQGLMLDVTVSDNLVLGDLKTIRDEAQTVQKRMKTYGISPSEPQLMARNLSGGNQQKLVVARALDRKVRAVVLAQPTRGVDLGAARGIHEAICATAQSGAGILIVSADLAELRAICHEIAVIVRGHIVAVLPPDVSEMQFGQAMLGEKAS